MTKNRFTFCQVLAMAVLSLAFSAQPAFAHEPPVILPTRLDFDASRAPKKCNNDDAFRSILGAWVPPTVLDDDAERRLVVRIRWTATGGKRAELSLVDAQGAVVAERHTEHPATDECYFVLYGAAQDAAELLGAFEPPPPKQPVTCPACAPCPSCPPARPCPTCPPPAPPVPTITHAPTLYRSSIGIGAFVGSGIHSGLGGGPYLLLSYAPWRQWSHVHVEFEGSWTSQTLESIRTHAIPLVGSLCLVRGVVRFCGGLATTAFYSNQSPNHDDLHLMFGGNFRVGTQLFVRGPFSIRADVLARIAFADKRFGKATMAIDDPRTFAAGLAVMGAWSVE
ncbi:MAG: hypothetical protein IPM54_42580 [Polyangiaceae bacterium]|nr:hypothetical protein [Polyangiaceae bacterium]